MSQGTDKRHENMHHNDDKWEMPTSAPADCWRIEVFAPSEDKWCFSAWNPKGVEPIPFETVLAIWQKMAQQQSLDPGYYRLLQCKTGEYIMCAILV